MQIGAPRMSPIDQSYLVVTARVRSVANGKRASIKRGIFEDGARCLQGLDNPLSLLIALINSPTPVPPSCPLFLTMDPTYRCEPTRFFSISRESWNRLTTGRATRSESSHLVRLCRKMATDGYVSNFSPREYRMRRNCT